MNVRGWDRLITGMLFQSLARVYNKNRLFVRADLCFSLRPADVVVLEVNST